MDENEIETPEVEEQATPDRSLAALAETTNLADGMDQEELDEIGDEAKKGYESDEATRADWLKDVEKWTELAKLVAKHKSFPWPNASNVKYPMLATAAMQFAARAYPSLVPSDGRIVKSRIIGKDPDGQKSATAEAVSLYMSYQLMDEMEGWEEEMDRLLIMLPIVGTLFKKTYWDPIKKTNKSCLILPQNLVVDYWATSLSQAERISEVLEINERKMKQRVTAGLWLDIDLDAPTADEAAKNKNAPSEVDATTPYVFIEQHTYLDLDDDGYKEPYIVTFHKTTGKVVRIAARYDEDSIHTNDEGELVCIDPIQYYTKYGFVPNPDGSFYDVGFGILLGPINESINTLINQLIDSGTINNLQSGFLGKGLRLRMGEQRFTPGEWKVVNSTGDDLKKQIVPLPSNEPSKVLFELLSLLITSGKELASVAEIFTGKMPGQNTPATTTMATVEQGMKVFTAVYKRIYRSLAEEFKKLYRLNSIYLNPNTYIELLDMVIGPDAFNLEDNRIVPGADPNATSQGEKLMKATGLMEMLMAGLPLNPVEVTIRMLEAQEQPNWQKLLPPEVLQTGQMPPAPPDPKMMEMQMKSQLEQQKIQMQGAAQQQKMQLEAQSEQVKMAMEKEKHAMDMQHQMEKSQVDMATALHKQRIFQVESTAKAEQNIRHSEEQHQMSLRQGDEMSKAKVERTKAEAKAKPSTKGAKK
jgi:chaperonin GroES